MSQVEILDAKNIDKDLWRGLQEIGVRACAATFAEGYDPEAYMGLDDLDRFCESHRNPMSEVIRDDGRLNANQDYFGAKVAIASVAGRQVGWSYLTHHNVSGGGLPQGPHETSLKARATRAAKLETSHDYVWWREVYTDPDYQNAGVAKNLIERSTRFFLLNRPMTAYPRPDIYRPDTVRLEKWLERLGFRVTDEWSKEAIGLGEVRQLRMQADSVRKVNKRLAV